MKNDLEKIPEIVSQKHLNLILENFLLKQLYENKKITYQMYEKIKTEIDMEINNVKCSFNNFIKTRNKETRTGETEL